MQKLFYLILTFLVLSSCGSRNSNSDKGTSSTETSTQNESTNMNLPPNMKLEDMSSITDQHLNVPYANASEAQKLDIFIPEGEGPFPVVVFIHGGAFRLGDKAMEYSRAKKMVQNGYVAVSINYRLSGEAIFPAAVHDCKAAIRYIRGNAKKYNIIPEKIGVWGPSAGGNLSAMMGTSGGNEFADGTVGDYLNISTKVQAVINWFGPIDFATMIPQAKALGFPSDYNVDNETQYIGADADDPANAELVAKANPVSYLDENDPPFWVEVGDQDPLIPYLQSKDFAEKLTQVLGAEKVSFTILEGEGHGGDLFEADENLNKAVSFFDKYLK